MIVLMMGPPGVGKGTHTALLAKHFGWPHISTGDMLRRASKQGLGEAADQLRELLAAGDMASDELVARLLKERISEEDCRNGYFLDGYPRNLAQAEELIVFLEETGERLDLVIELYATPEVLKERISGRLVDPVTGDNYHKSFAPPPDGMIATRVIQRPEDHENIVPVRLRQFERKTRRTIEYFRLLAEKKGWKNPFFADHDAGLPAEQVQKDLIAMIEQMVSVCASLKETQNKLRSRTVP